LVLQQRYILTTDITLSIFGYNSTKQYKGSYKVSEKYQAVAKYSILDNNDQLFSSKCLSFSQLKRS